MPPSVKPQPISGFPEWLPAERRTEQRMLATIREQFELFGFAPIETPAVERLDVLLAKGGIERQIYTLGKPQEGSAKSEPKLALHFDLTVPLARYVAVHAGRLTFPFRRYQIQKVWRGERAQRGRFREFYQCDIDVVGRGKLDPIHDAEMPVLINAVFEAMGLPEFYVLVSNRRVLEDLLGVKRGGGERLEGALRAIDKFMRDGEEKTRGYLTQEGVDADLIPRVMELIQCKTPREARGVLRAAGAKMEGLDELEAILEGALSLGMPERRLRPNFAIARGLDYYTGAVFETYVEGREGWGSICSGGRYDDLASYFTAQKYPGVGVSIGLTRLFDLLIKEKLIEPEAASPTRVLVTTQDRDAYLSEYLELARLVRAAGIPAEVYLDRAKLGVQLSYADAKGVALALVAGEKEIAAGEVAVKDLAARTQQTVPKSELIEYIEAKLGR